MRTLNYFMPGSYTALLDDAGPVNRHVFDRYIIYYKLISGLTGGNADAYAMLGICYSRLEQDRPAIKFLEKAMALKPQSFWAGYDLGALYLKNNDHTKSSQILTQAISIPPQTAFG
ncbi:MAG: tetratricopeptide repeat protein, partial [Candidatus Omnitrophica bacterium]|nr:tetratricopeptide repeat protein [Candidatus Omnitrophota bacterium]